MNPKSAQVLELAKILERLATYTSFSASYDLALTLEPTPYLDEAEDRLQETTEARTLLLNHDHITIGGARDVRGDVLSAARGVILEPQTILDVRETLRRASTLRRLIQRLHHQYPMLATTVELLEECSALQHEISRVLDDTGDVKDSASAKLATLRRQMRVAFDRLQSKLSNIVNNSNNAQYLQETLVTQRHGRYVIPLKAPFKGRIPGIVHDQSASGATLFIEPLSTVELNNEWRELQLEEENEVRRILRELCELIGHESKYIVRTVETLARMDLIFAKAKYAEELVASAPELVGFRDAPYPHPGSTIHLFEARHPLLDPDMVVPIDVELDEDTYVLVITGPNTGGKTVALKTVGLLTLMAQCGLHIPAREESRLTVYSEVFADIGDEQSIEQSLSTFSSHMTNIITILDEAGPESLVILDEVGAGTDPAEGSALARALLDDLVGRGITTLVTTHHPELKVYSHEKPGVRNASVEFDLETLAPTYRLIVGLPGRSNALAIAERLGLPERIVTGARGLITEEDLIADDLLDEIHKTRDQIRQTEEAARHKFEEAELLRAELQERLDHIETERRELLVQTREDADTEMAELRAEIRRLRKRLQAAGQPLDVIKQIEEASAGLGDNFTRLPEPVARGDDRIGDDEPHQFRLGDLVWVATLGAEGQISELSEQDAEVMVGRLRVRAKLDELAYRSKSESKREKKRQRAEVGIGTRGAAQGKDTATTSVKSPGLELDLRGQRVEDAIPNMEDYLDAAYMAGMPFVRIIHGKGTGVLRSAVRDRLHGHPLVTQYERGNHKEGGDGVTVVKIVPQQ
ncbi:MAG: endonuclease MutS2 [Chloroflexi bacterium]|nr:endonuclease MutS2 [Chloroflexota bacterium]